MAAHISNLLILPDEMLLEIYKYLLNAHVLYSFYGLNHRLNVSITKYCRHVSLADITYNQFHYLCHSILPKFGSQIQSLLLSDCRSVLQSKIFSQYFSHQMSTIFPNLTKLVLMCFTADQLDAFLNTLTNLDKLHEIEIYDLLTDNSNLLQRIVETNNNRFNTIKFKTIYSNSFTSPCLNIQNLTISIQTLDKLYDLLSFIPNICQLNVTIDETSMMEARFDDLSPLIYLKRFFLRFYDHYWSLKEIHSLFNKLSSVEYLSLQISSRDTSFVNSQQKIFDILPKTIQEFNFCVRYFYDEIEEIDRHALLTSRFPMICLIDENLQLALLHTIPYRFPLFNISPPMAKQMSTYENYQNVEMFSDSYGMTLTEAFPIIARCRRINEIAIQLYHEDDEISSTVQQPQLSPLPNLYYLKRLWLLHPSREYNSLKLLLQIAPNLSELFIAFDNLQPIFDDYDTCQLLSDRIVHVLILRPAPTAPNAITEQYIPDLARIFKRIRHLQIDVTGGSFIELIVLSVLNAFKESAQLISLVIEGQTSSEQLKTNTRQWLIDNSYFTSDGKFDAFFKEQTNRFLLWM